MIKKFHNRFTVAALAAAATLTLIAGASTAAHADPTPTGTGSYDVATFKVYWPGLHTDNKYATVEGTIWGGTTSTRSDDLSLLLLCDGLPYPLQMTGQGTQIKFNAQLPLALEDHTCTLTSFPKTGQRTWFAPPQDIWSSSASNVTEVNAQLVTGNRRSATY